MPERAEFNSVVKHSTAIYKIIIAILSICLFIVIVYVLYQSENIDLVTAILSMSLTSVIYLFVPIILIVIGKKFSNAKLILVSIANGTIIWILFYFCSLLYAGMPNSAATFIWSVVGYLLMRWKILSSKASKPSAPSIKRLQVLSLVLAIIVSCLFWVIAFFSVAYYVSEREEMGTFTTTYKPEKRRLMGKKEFKRIMDHLHNTPKTSDFID